jgi:hypothetical protein
MAMGKDRLMTEMARGRQGTSAGRRDAGQGKGRLTHETSSQIQDR